MLTPELVIAVAAMVIIVATVVLIGRKRDGNHTRRDRRRRSHSARDPRERMVRGSAMMRHLRQLHTFGRTWWAKVPDPRIVVAIVAVVYTVAFFWLGGIGTLTNPPRSITGTIGEAAMQGVAILFILGYFPALIGCLRDFWELERVGIAFMAFGALIYSAIVIILHVTSEGSRLLQLGMLTAGLGFLALRLAMIGGYDFKPRKVAHDDDLLPR